MDQLLTIREIAQRLKVSPKTIYKWTHLRKIPVARAGRLLRFNETDVLNWMKQDVFIPRAEPIGKKTRTPVRHKSREKAEIDRLVESCTREILD